MNNGSLDPLTGNNDNIRTLIGRARQRFFVNVAVAQGVLAGSVGMAGAVFLLVFGAQFLDWRWLALLALVTFPLAYFRTARRVPSPYRVAQIVDARLGLRDALSTALYFSDHDGPGRTSEYMRREQLAESERIGSQVDPKAAVPLETPRTAYLFGALFLAALALMGVRYGVQRRLDLDKPLARILMDAFGGGGPEQRAALKKNKKSVDIWGQAAMNSADGLENQYQEGEGLKGQETLEQASGASPKSDADRGASQDGDPKGKSDNSEGNGENTGSESEQSDSAKGSSGAKEGDQPGGSKQGENTSNKQSPNSQSDSSLASKIKDAMSNLLSSMRKSGESSSQQNPGKNGDPKSQQSKAGQKGGQGQKKGDESNADSEDGQQGDAEGRQSADAKASSQSSDGPSSGDKGSGAGKQDGLKDAKLAEQLAAMGKISEIIGKRSANVTGEVTVEVTSAKQPLRTPYSDGRAAHSESGGEINRDEVPAAFQEYVQQYFEQVRKPAKGASKPSGAGGPQSQ